MALIGFFALNLALGCFTCGALIFIFEALGEYNIGGVPNSRMKRGIALIALCCLPIAWYFLWQFAPFSFHMDTK